MESKMDDQTVSRLYRQLPPPQPSTALDAAILAAARVAVEPNLQPARAIKRKPVWFMPLSLAATLVIASGVVLMVYQGAPDGRGHAEVQPGPLHTRLLETPPPAEAAPEEMALADAPTLLPPAPPQIKPPLEHKQARLAGTAGHESQQPKIGPPLAEVRVMSGPPTTVAAAPAAIPASKADVPEKIVVSGSSIKRAAKESAKPASPLADRVAEQKQLADDPALQQIRKLLAEGNERRALLELKRWQERHPGTALPPDLQTLLDE